MPRQPAKALEREDVRRLLEHVRSQRHPSRTRPDGEYAIVECLGHRTLVGRTAEVERFGTKMLALEPIWQDALLPAVLIGGSSIYALTPCSADIAFARQAKQHYELPASLRAVAPLPALAAPVEDRDEAMSGWDPDDEPDGDGPF